jgi:hypothetical protein
MQGTYSLGDPWTQTHVPHAIQLSGGRVLCSGGPNRSNPRGLEFVSLIKRTLGPLVHRIRRVFFAIRLEFSLLQNGTDLL